LPSNRNIVYISVEVEVSMIGRTEVQTACEKVLRTECWVFSMSKHLMTN